MAGIGVKLNRIYQKNTITTNIVGFFYSMTMTIAPVLVVIINLMLMQKVLKFNTVRYIDRELFSCTVLYVFIFSLLTTSPFNAVLSRYMSDAIFEERYEDVLPCHRIGLLINICFSCLFAIPFCLWEHFVGKVPVYYVFTGYCCFVSLVLVFYNMLYLSICKEYRLISLHFALGMIVSFLLSLFFRYICKMSIPYSMLLSLAIGFFVTAVFEWAKVHQFFPDNSEEYRRVFVYFKRYWHLILINFLYTLGLFIHNFVFWRTDMAMHLVKTFVCNQPYDMATCLAMFTNLSASVIFISRVEMYFHERYKAYADAVFGGRGLDIQNTRKRMFRQLGSELMTLIRLQFIISVVIYLIFVIFLPRMGYAGLVMRIYPMVAAGYFILFLMYSEIIFLYYFEDLQGALVTALSFCGVTFLASLIAVHLPAVFFGVGIWTGSVVGFTVAYMRLRWMETHIDEHMFCRGNLIKNSVNMKQQGRFLPDKLLWRILADGAPTMPKEYDLAVAYLEGGATYYVADRVKAKKKAAFIHIDYKKAGYGEKLDLGCYEKIDRIFTVSDEVKEHFLEVYPKYQNKVSVFHNLLDMDNVRTMAEKPGGFQDDFKGIRLLTVGRLVAQKRYDMVIQTMILLKQKSKKPIRWYIMGEGELRTKLEQQISENHLTEDVILLGVKENPFPYYKQCDIYVHATGYEGKSIAIQEAQILKKPILATDCSGNREQIEQGIDGRLCILTPESISNEILWMIEHPKECQSYGEKAEKKVLQSNRGLDEFLNWMK